jgi:threonine dehydratase
MTIAPTTLAEARAARERIARFVVRTPLVPAWLEGADEPPVLLKLEVLQPIGSFKLRGASHALAVADPKALARGVWTASAGNMAQGVAWQARRLGVPCVVVAPDHAPRAKLDPLERLGARVQLIPFAEWFEILRTHSYPGMQGVFVHPVSDPAVMAGNATIALELIEDQPDLTDVIVPWGGGGLSCGIAGAMRGLAPHVRVWACEVDTAAPLAASLAAGEPTRVEYRASFVDGIGGPFVLPEMWPLATSLLAGSIVVTIPQVADAVRQLATRAHVIAEGAGASSVAAARTGRAGAGRVACIVSGGNLDPAKLDVILAGGVP